MKIALSGSTGKMGQAIEALVKSRPQMEVTARSHTKHSPWSWNPEVIHGVIDFSLPPLFRETSLWCEKHKKPLVSGTTGLTEWEFQELKRMSSVIPLFYGENMSWGIWQMGLWISSLKGALPEAVLKDIHHKNKKDSPSGTALRLKKLFPKPFKDKLKIVSVREGEEFGTHKVELKTPWETLILEHNALSREVFAEGALKALEWLIQKPPGLYGPEHLYGGI